jgi:hypothetical protein
MRPARRRKIQWLFSNATGVASHGHEIAVDGQSPRHNARQYALLAKELHRNSVDLANAAADIWAALTEDL